MAASVIPHNPNRRLRQTGQEVANESQIVVSSLFLRRDDRGMPTHPTGRTRTGPKKGRPCEQNFTIGIEEEFQIVDPCTRELRMREGAGADRQLAVWKRAGDLKAVVDHIIAETYAGLHMAKTKAA
jgi:hypothetical protein